MREIITLTKTLFKSSKTGKNKTSKIKFSTIILYAIVYFYFVGLIVNFSYSTLTVLKELNYERYLVNAFVYFAVFYSIFHGMVSVLNLLYFSKDIDYLLPLPIKPEKIVISKINVIIINQYLVAALIFAPFFIVYGIVEKLTFIYYIILLSVLLVINIVPVLLTALIVSLIMKVTKVIKNKDTIQYFSSFVAIVIIVAIQFLSTKIGELSNEEYGMMYVNFSNNLDSKLTLFYTVKPIYNALVGSNLIERIKNIGVLYAETFITGLICIKLVSHTYFKTLYGISKTSDEKVSDKKLRFNKKPLIKGYVSKEFKLLFRNPIFFMQCVVPIVIFPLIILIPFVVTYIGAHFNGEQTELQESLNIIKTVLNKDYMILSISIIAALLLNMLNYVSVTAISRDGSNATFMKSIPIPLYRQIIYKAVPGIIFGMFPMFYFLIFMICFGIAKPLNIFYYFICFMLINIYTNLACIDIDIKRPKIDWISEYAVVKQNLNMLFQLFIVSIEIISILVLFALKLSAVIEALILITIYTFLICIKLMKFKKEETRILDTIY